MNTLREILNRADASSVAIGHFNVADWVLLKAVFGAARELNVPVLVGVSEGERSFSGFARLPPWCGASGTNSIFRSS